MCVRVILLWSTFVYHCFRGKAISITCYECVFMALDIHHAMRMTDRKIFFRIISQIARFSNIKCVLIFSTMSETFLILSFKWDMIKNEQGSSCKVPAVFVRFEWNLYFLDFFLRNILRYHISWKSIQWVPSCSKQSEGQTDRQTDRRTDGHDKDDSGFSKFC
jgi:hypothetical protein